MKKVIGIVGVLVLALSMFFSTTSIEINDMQSIGLSDLALINTASAEDWGDNIYGCSSYDDEWYDYYEDGTPYGPVGGKCSLGGYCYIDYASTACNP